jgi:hypothetical protein
VLCVDERRAGRQAGRQVNCGGGIGISREIHLRIPIPPSTAGCALHISQDASAPAAGDVAPTPAITCAATAECVMTGRWCLSIVCTCRTNQLTSSFPQTRAAAQWFQEDTTCNRTVPRAVLAQQVSLECCSSNQQGFCYSPGLKHFSTLSQLSLLFCLAPGQPCVGMDSPVRAVQQWWVTQCGVTSHSVV